MLTTTMIKNAAAVASHNLSHVFVLVGPLASRFAESTASGLSAHPNHNQSATTTTVLLGPTQQGPSSLEHSTNNLLLAPLQHIQFNQTSQNELISGQTNQSHWSAERNGNRLEPRNPFDNFTRVSYDSSQQNETLLLLMDRGGATTATATATAATTQSFATILNKLTGFELLLVFLLIGLILISIVGNCLVCVAICTDRRLRKLGNAFIVSLAIADLFVSCLVMTFALCNDLMDYWMFGERFCDIWISFDIMCCTASILNLCAISLDRFIHIKDCLLYNQLMTRKVALAAVLGIWLISALVSFVPINLGWHKPDHFKSTPNSLGNISRLQLIEMRATTFAFDQSQSQSQTHTPLRRQRRSMVTLRPVWLTNENKNQNENANHEEKQEERNSENNATVNRRHNDISQLEHCKHLNTFAQTPDERPIIEKEAAELVSRSNRRRDQTRTLARDGFASSQFVNKNNLQPSLSSGAANSLRAQVDFLPNFSGARFVADHKMANLGQPPDQIQGERNHFGGSNPQDGFGAPVRVATVVASPPVQGRKKRKTSDHGQFGLAETKADIEEQTSSTKNEDPSNSISEGQHRNSANPRQIGHRLALDQTASESPPPPPQCMLTLTPTYAIISSTISFFIPCLIMLGLYSKLFACAQRHVKNIRAITRAPHPIAPATANNCAGSNFSSANTSNLAPAVQNTNNKSPTTTRRTSSSSTATAAIAASRRRVRTWIKFSRPRQRAANGATETTGSGQETRRLPDDNQTAGRGAALSGSKIRAANKQEQTGKDNCAPAPDNTDLNGNGHEVEAGNEYGNAIRGEQEQPFEKVPCVSKQTDKSTQKCSPSSLGVEALPNSMCYKTNDETMDRSGGANETREPTESEPFLDPSNLHDSNAGSCRNSNSNSNSNTPSVCDKPAVETNVQSNASGRQKKFVANFSAATIKLNLTTGSTKKQQKHKQQQQQQHQHQQQQTSQLATHKAAKTLGIIMGTFLFCWVPFFFLNIIKSFYVDSIPGSVFRAFTWLGYANSALNPIIYGIHNSEFRNAFNRIFFKHLTLKNGRQYLSRRFSYDLRPHHHPHQNHQQQHQQHNNYQQQPQQTASIFRDNPLSQGQPHTFQTAAATTITATSTSSNGGGNNNRDDLSAGSKSRCSTEPGVGEVERVA